VTSSPSSPAPHARRGPLIALVLACCLGVAAGCTGGRQPAAAPSPSSSTSTGSAATISAAPVPLVVRVVRVSGGLSKADRSALEHNLGTVVTSYLQHAYLGGSWPRSDFSDAFTYFTPGVRAQARGDQDLLTNHQLGASTRQVTAKETTAYLSVLAPHRVAAGVSARLTLRYVADRGDASAAEVHVVGRLSFTRTDAGWRIVGYHLARSVRAVSE